MAKITYRKIVEAKLESMKVEDTFDIGEFLEDHWGLDNYFTRRSFDVVFCKTKNEIFSERVYKSIERKIVRLK